jgi:hypothetical protein
MRRPIAVTLLAFTNLIQGLERFAIALGFLFAPHLLSSVRLWFDGSVNPFNSEDYDLSHRALFFFLTSLFGLVSVVWAWGLWRLKNWARAICIFFAILDLGMVADSTLGPLPALLSMKLASAIWPHSHFVTSGLLGTVLNYVAATIVLVYLQKSSVKQAFGANPAEWKWITAVGCFAVIVLGHSLYKSGPELKAIQWHARHGDQVTVNGVVFPVYYWHAPTTCDKESGFRISDRGAGPLRPQNMDSFMAFEVLGYSEEPNNLTADQIVEKKIQYYEKSGYTKFDKFDMHVAKEKLACISVDQFGPHGPVYCFGKGPIYSVYFVGRDRSEKLFQSVLSAAKQTQDESSKKVD